MDLAALNLIAEKHIRTALEEDLNHGDVSAAAVVPAGAQATVELIAKQEGVIAGLDVFERTFHLLDPAVCVERFVADGSRVEVGQLLARISGDAFVLLAAERTALNYLQRMSGIATYTRQIADLLEGSKTTL
ncbi:MAG: nicotinate-nucleotide diphosphorylase, partial [Anaerovoracaceae bacterium]